MTRERNSKKVQDELAKKNVDSSDKKLTFDPTTGELIIKEKDEPTDNPDEIVVDQIYEDGFFNCMSI